MPRSSKRRWRRSRSPARKRPPPTSRRPSRPNRSPPPRRPPPKRQPPRAPLLLSNRPKRRSLNDEARMTEFSVPRSSLGRNEPEAPASFAVLRGRSLAPVRSQAGAWGTRSKNQRQNDESQMSNE